ISAVTTSRLSAEQIQRADVRAQRVMKDADIPDRPVGERIAAFFASFALFVAFLLLIPVWMVWVLPGALISVIANDQRWFTWLQSIGDVMSNLGRVAFTGRTTKSHYADDAVKDERDFDRKRLETAMV